MFCHKGHNIVPASHKSLNVKGICACGSDSIYTCSELNNSNPVKRFKRDDDKEHTHFCSLKRKTIQSINNTSSERYNTEMPVLSKELGNSGKGEAVLKGYKVINFISDLH